MSKLKYQPKHRFCPNHCHRCPDLDGDVMPGCMGTAAFARDGKDKSYCTCVRHNRSREEQLERELKDLRERISRLEAALPEPRK